MFERQVKNKRQKPKGTDNNNIKRNAQKIEVIQGLEEHFTQTLIINPRETREYCINREVRDKKKHSESMNDLLEIKVREQKQINQYRVGVKLKKSCSKSNKQTNKGNEIKNKKGLL